MINLRTNTAILFINNITKLNLSPRSSLSLILYANDILYFQTISFSDCFLNIQSDLNNISEWVSSQHLTINISKSKYNN